MSASSGRSVTVPMVGLPNVRVRADYSQPQDAILFYVAAQGLSVSIHLSTGVAAELVRALSAALGTALGGEVDAAVRDLLDGQ